MRRRTCFILLCLLLPGCGLPGFDLFNGPFQNVGADTTTRFFHRASLLQDGRVMITGGMLIQPIPPTLITLDKISFFDPATGNFSDSFTPTGATTSTRPVLPTARSYHTQTTLPDGRVLITGGYTKANGTSVGIAINSVLIFNPTTGHIAIGPPMDSPRADHTATLSPDGRVIVAGSDTWQDFDPTNNSWSDNHHLWFARESHSAVLLNDFPMAGDYRILLIGGSGDAATRMELLNPVTGTSTPTAAALPLGINDTAAARLDDGTVLIVGGQDSITGETNSNCYLYDPTADTLTPTASLPDRPDGISDHEIIVVGRFAYIFGGEQEVAGQDLELDYAAIYDRAATDWVKTLHMNHAHDDFPAVRLNDGRILLIGGGAHFFGFELPSADAELFDPAALTIP